MTSCDEYGTAKSTVSDFMDENLKSGSPRDLEFIGADTTLFVSDSLILSMRTQTEKSGVYKSGLKYAALPAPRKLIYVKTSYKKDDGSAQMRQTFYLGEDQKQVYCVKIDPTIK